MTWVRSPASQACTAAYAAATNAARACTSRAKPAHPSSKPSPAAPPPAPGGLALTCHAAACAYLKPAAAHAARRTCSCTAFSAVSTRRPLAARRRHRGVGGVVFGDVPRVGLPHLCGVCNCHLEKTSVHLLRMLCTHKSDLRSSTNLSRDKPNIQSRERWVIGEEAGEEANKKAQWEPLVDGR